MYTVSSLLWDVRSCLVTSCVILCSDRWHIPPSFLIEFINSSIHSLSLSRLFFFVQNFSFRLPFVLLSCLSTYLPPLLLPIIYLSTYLPTYLVSSFFLCPFLLFIVTVYINDMTRVQEHVNSYCLHVVHGSASNIYFRINGCLWKTLLKMFTNWLYGLRYEYWVHEDNALQKDI
jgi:hypothetical protein